MKKRLPGTGLRWRGWYAFRRGLATNLWELGVDPKVIAVILRNSEEVTRRHYIKLLEDRKHASEGMNKLEAAFERAEMLQKAETGRTQ
jgi:intergrase/recombinase